MEVVITHGLVETKFVMLPKGKLAIVRLVDGARTEATLFEVDEVSKNHPDRPD